MKKYKKYISFTLLFALAISNFAIAQSSNKGEIVMTKIELEAFLSKIAQLKKDQLLKKQSITERNNQIDDSLINLIQKNQEINTKDKFLFDEIERLNNRIDLLLLNSREHASSTNSVGITEGPTTNSKNANQRQPTITKIEAKSVQPSGNIQKSSDLSINNNPITHPEKYEKTLVKTQPSNTTINNYYSTQEKRIPNNQINRQPDTTIIIYQENKEAQKAINELVENQFEELSRLKNQIAGLKEQIRVLSLLDVTLKANNNKDEIKALEAKVEELNNNLRAQSKSIDTIVQIREVTKEEPFKTTTTETDISKNFKSFVYTIYFENNSIKIEAKDNTSITELANMVKDHTPNVTVVLRGFASNVGTAQYNNKISFNRAEAVRKALIKNGLKAKDIVVLNHGIDKDTDDAKARRVEITLLTY
ncbi:MAG TPA: OmpA family protein [Edaphocola sp.]|nr:OmpA family protein [Edaphocola sp.]